jgi:diguanylate cyclase (GGDEF)-like protein
LVIARRVYGIVRVASLLSAVVLAVLCGPSAARALGASDIAFLCGAFLVAIALGVIRPPAAHFERSMRPTPESDRVGLLIPVLLAVLATEGWLWAALLNVVASLVRIDGLRRRSLLDRLLTSALRFPGWWVAGLVAGALRGVLAAAPTAAALATFTGIATGVVLVMDLAWIDPLAAARQGRSLLRVWQRHLADRGTILTAVAEGAWAYVIARVLLSDGALLGIGTMIPLVVFAVVLVRFARANARLHRLTISRAAVDAMLRASDPQPQMRSLLESVDPRIVRESVEIAAFGRGGGDQWTRLVRFGPPVTPEVERRGARVLLELQVTGEDVVVDHSDEGSVQVYAARDGEQRLRGALLVYRAPQSVPLVSPREFERAAAELGPLLGEYGAITATRTAATVDTLTGLANRRGVQRAFEEAMTYVRAGGRYAVLLLDIDHFKSINDLLGHQAGDRVLAQIGKVIAENIRGVDVAGRFGGEEFLVLLRDASRERALHVAERLREAIETGGFAYADGKPVTVSVGVAYARAVDGTADVVERADRALYRAKNAGRNRVVESPLLAV